MSAVVKVSVQLLVVIITLVVIRW